MWIVRLGLPRPYSFGAAKVDLAVTQRTARAQSRIGDFPPGAQPPSIPEYDSPRVSILQSGLVGKVLAPQELFELGQNLVPTASSTVAAALVRLPNGGNFRAVEVDLKPHQMHAKHPTSSDISNALNQPNLIPTAGATKLGDKDYPIRLDISPRALDWGGTRGHRIFEGRGAGAQSEYGSNLHRAHQRHSERPSHDPAERHSFDGDGGGRAARRRFPWPAEDVRSPGVG